jgi:hypothetical protein
VKTTVASLFALLAAAWLQGCGAPAGSAPSPAPRPATNPTESNRTGPPAGDPNFTLDADGRTALATMQRLNMITSCEEARPGLLRLTLGSGWVRPTAEYHLNHIYNGYTPHLDPDQAAVLELWQGGQKIGEYTIDGLLMGPEFSTPR